MSSEINSKSIFQKGLTFPEELYLQVHTNTSNLIKDINNIQKSVVAEFKDISRFVSKDKPESWSYISRESHIDEKSMIKTLNEAKRKSEEPSLEFYHNLMSVNSLSKISQKICSTLPNEETPCYFKALLHAEKTFKDRSIDEFKSDEILTLLNDIYKLAANKTNLQYRPEESTVIRFNFFNRETKEMTPIIKQIVNDENDLKIWDSICNRKKGSKPKQEHQDFLNKYITPRTTDPKNIPDLMKTFSAEFVEKLQAAQNTGLKGEIVKLMAWAHLELVKIHPWEDCNGRVSRIFMHIIGLQAGIQPIIFDNEDEYTLAILGYKTDTFAQYLCRRIWNPIALDSYNKSVVRDWLNKYQERFNKKKDKKIK